MALYPLHKYFVFNNDIRSNQLFIPSENEGGIYEVLRVKEGVPLFLEAHLDRFYRSAEIAGKNIRFFSTQIKTLLKELIRQNNVSEGNVLISSKLDLKMFFIPHNYPSEDMYKRGVKCGVLKAERVNPNAKVFQTSVRAQANGMLEENDFYEVLLVNQSDCITEGSRSNVFFVYKEKLITPPAFNVLQGITRQKVITIAKNLGITFAEEEVKIESLSSFESAFITGTSPKILPLRQIDKLVYGAPNELVLTLVKCYDMLIESYITINGNFRN